MAKFLSNIAKDKKNRSIFNHERKNTLNFSSQNLYFAITKNHIFLHSDNEDKINTNRLIHTIFVC